MYGRRSLSSATSPRRRLRFTLSCSSSPDGVKPFFEPSSFFTFTATMFEWFDPYDSHLIGFLIVPCFSCICSRPSSTHGNALCRSSNRLRRTCSARRSCLEQCTSIYVHAFMPVYEGSNSAGSAEHLPALPFIFPSSCFFFLDPANISQEHLNLLRIPLVNRRKR